MDQLISTGQVASRLGVTRMTVQRLVHRGTLAAQVTPLGFLFTPGDVQAYQDAHRLTPVEP